MSHRTLDDAELPGPRVLLRADLNVPLEEGEVADDFRIRMALPTIRELLERGLGVVVMTHLGRPKGKVVPELSAWPVARALARELDDVEVTESDDVAGERALAAAQKLCGPGVLVLENLRFDPGESAGDEGFARRLAALGHCYVNDAFGTCHRPHASVTVLARLLPAAAGRLLEKEVEALRGLLEAPQRPLVAVLGGAKISDKIPIVENLLDRVDVLVIGGAMAYTFLAARGEPVGQSLVEPDELENVRRFMATASARGIELLLPVDHVMATSAEAGAVHKVVERIEPGWCGVDIGPATTARFAAAIKNAGTVVANGPMGCFEIPEFARGSRRILEAVAEAEAWSVIGGGDSARAVREAGLWERMGHVSTGGGAFMEMLAGKTLPGLAALESL